MDKIDIDRLTSLLGDEFETGSNYDDQHITVRKKFNPLLGCEFYIDKDGIVYKMTPEIEKVILSGARIKRSVVPASEEQYVEQLRVRAFHLYGGINESDTFENPEGGKSYFCSGDFFKYLKEQDQLMLGQILLYDKGKWAKRVPKDIWEGVEFYQTQTNNTIHKITLDFKNIMAYGIKLWVLPSTEEAYIEQLKTKVFELFGEIKEHDKFEEPSGNVDTYSYKDIAYPKWNYVKQFDELFYHSILLYKEGKWAKRFERDIWKGVEFAEFIGLDRPNQFTEGKVYKINAGLGERHFVIDDQNNGNGFLNNGINFKPSTEEAYIEQLKDSAFRVFGEINMGDRFDRTGFEFLQQSPLIIAMGSFKCSRNYAYFKVDDSLALNGVIIYQQGQWAKKLPKRIRVSYDDDKNTSHYLRYENDARQKIEEIGYKEVGEFLAEQLEKYLNGEIK